ncbi:MAG TPA: iron-sulfur cluster repair protein YtfE [Vicinamibacterales bacterium]|nr:iron-sulfur cluster repair protein YtfE [Vicinamibacterales bacterium]
MTSSSTLADLATTHPAAARVFYRHGLDFCCGGRRSLSDVCAERGLDTAAVIAAIETEERGPDDDTRWDREPLTALMAFIVNSYHRRLRESLPELIRMAEKVEARHADKASCPRGLAAHLHAMHESVLEHLVKEEQVLFPLIANGQGRIAVGPVHVMEMEHEEHARALRILRTLTTNFEAPAEACVTWRALYLGLQQLEEELMLHIHLENNVLFRRALIE